MNLKQPIVSEQFGNQRKRQLVEHVEASLEEQDRWREFNAAYHEDDRKFMQFLIPHGKRVLELGCGRGDLLAALKPSYGVGIDFGAETIAKANARHPDLYFVLGDVEDPATLAEIEGTYNLVDKKLNLRGVLHTSGKLADTTSGFKSVVIKALGPFLKKKSITVVPFAITGTPSDPSFALDLTAKR